jgi:hypothetical protein
MGPVPINYLAIVVAAIAGFLTGWGWYAMFGNAWMAGLGKTKAETKPKPLPFILAMLANLVMAWVLAGLVGHLHDVTIKGAMISALFVWAGFVATTTVVNQQFRGKKPVVTAIDAGHWLAVLLVMGAIIGAFGA